VGTDRERLALAGGGGEIDAVYHDAVRGGVLHEK
jgi:hypothetical protein